MNKKLQDLAWQCLTREVRDEIKERYKILSTSFLTERYMELRNTFGHHNLTSDIEPPELLFVERKKVQEYKSDVDYGCACSFDSAYAKGYWYGQCATLDKLFGDKCLPDKEWKDTCYGAMGTTPPDVKLDVKPTPKFKVGDKVRVLAERAFGRIEEIEVYDDDDNTYRLEYLPNFWFDPSELEPYTEENNKPMEEKELNLLELLKGCEGEMLYSLIDGEVKLKQLTDDVICQYHKYHRSGYLSGCALDGVCQLYPSRALYEKYPLDPYSAWMEWKEARKPKRWRAEKGEDYIFIDTDCILRRAKEEKSFFDDKRYKYGNYFKDDDTAKQAAQDVRECLEQFHSQNQKQNGEKKV